MNKRTASFIVLIATIIPAVAVWGILNQFSDFQTQIRELQAQNSELQSHNHTLQDQLRELQLQNREQQDRLKDFTSELARSRPLLVEITSFSWLGGWSAIGGVTAIYPVNVTVQNDDVVPLCGLTVVFRLQQKDLGTRIGEEGVRRIDRINAGESLEVTGGAYTMIGTPLDDAVYVITLSVGDIVLDTWTGV